MNYISFMDKDMNNVYENIFQENNTSGLIIIRAPELLIA